MVIANANNLYNFSCSGVDEERIKSVEKDFERQSSVCIEPFIRAGLFDRARTLAEDFQHFQSLIDVSQVCCLQSLHAIYHL